MFSSAFHRDLAAVLDTDCADARARVLAHARAHALTACRFADTGPGGTGRTLTFCRRASRKMLRVDDVQDAVFAYFREAEAHGAEPSPQACAEAATGTVYEVVVK